MFRIDSFEWAKLKINFDKPSYPQFNPVWISRSGLFGSLAFATALIWVKTARVKNKVCKSDFNSSNIGPTGKFQLSLKFLSISGSNEPNRSPKFKKEKKSRLCTVKILIRGHFKQCFLEIVKKGPPSFIFGTKKDKGSQKSRAGNSNRVKLWVWWFVWNILKLYSL